MKHKSEIFVDTFFEAVNNPDNWNEKGIDWNFIDADLYAPMSIFYSGDKYVWIFEDMAAKFETQWGENVTFEEYSKAKEKWYAENS